MFPKMPEGHGEGGDASKCPFAMMMKAMEANPKLAEKYKNEAEEFDTDTEDDSDDGDYEHHTLGGIGEDEGAMVKRAPVDEPEDLDNAETKERRKRMHDAMMAHFDREGGAAKAAELTPKDFAMMQKMVTEKEAAAAAGGHAHGEDGDASKCPFAAMFGMPPPEQQPRNKAKPPSIVEKFMRENAEELAEEARQEAAGETEAAGCPFAQMFDVKEATGAQAEHVKMLEEGDKPGKGQYIWKRNNQGKEAAAAEQAAKAPVAKGDGPKQFSKLADMKFEDDEEELAAAAEEKKRKMGVPKDADGFNDAIKQAGQMKSAMMKADPRRREWEQAPMWMRCTCGEEGELGDARGLEAFADRLKQATEWREKANDLFRKGRYDPAISIYTNSMAIFYWFKRGPNRSTENIRLINELDELEGEGKSQATDAVVKAFVNIAACLVKTEKWQECQYACSKALSLDPGCVKALYRRAQAYKAENSAYMLELAVKDLRKASELQPSNTDVKKTLRAYLAELKDQNKKDGEVFGEMFTRGGLYSAEEADAMKKPALPPGLPPLGKDAKDLASSMGIDLDDPKVVAELQRLHNAKIKADLEGKSVDDVATEEPRKRHWWIEMTLKYKWVAYVMLIVHVSWMCIMMFWKASSEIKQGRQPFGPQSNAASSMMPPISNDNISAGFDPPIGLPPDAAAASGQHGFGEL